LLLTARGSEPMSCDKRTSFYCNTPELSTASTVYAHGRADDFRTSGIMRVLYASRNISKTVKVPTVSLLYLAAVKPRYGL